MFEHHREPLASQAEFKRRVLRFGSLSIGIIMVSLGIGVIGYHFIVGLAWIDALLNASMLLGGMGPMDTDLKTTAAKLFASAYALFSGVVFLVAIGILSTPIFHRFLHHFHLELDDED
jgi:hypothetical protein